jgi:hypothetical protein
MRPAQAKASDDNAAQNTPGSARHDVLRPQQTARGASPAAGPRGRRLLAASDSGAGIVSWAPPGVAQRDGGAQDALAAAQAVCEGGEVLVHPDRGRHGQVGGRYDLGQHLGSRFSGAGGSRVGYSVRRCVETAMGSAGAGAVGVDGMFLSSQCFAGHVAGPQAFVSLCRTCRT